MIGSRQHHRWWLALGAVMPAAFGLRVVLGVDRVLTPEYVNFQGVDSWYHVRLIENLVRNFPHWLSVDPYAIGGGQRVAVAPFFNVVVAAMAWLTGFGSPSPSQIEVVAAVIPPLIAALITVPVYLIGAHVFSRRTGAMAATLLAAMPGPLLERTTFGYVDHHGMEVLLATFTIWLLMTGTGRGILAGLLLGCYLLTWTSGAFLVGVLGLWLVVQALFDYLCVRPITTRPLDACAASLVALGLVVLVQDHQMFRFGSQVAAVSALAGLAVLFDIARRTWPPSVRTRYLVPCAFAGACLAGSAGFVLLLPAVSRVLLGDLSRFTPGIAGQTVTEAVPFFYLVGNRFSFAPGWIVFKTAFFLGLVALAPLTRRVWRDGRPAETLLWTWTLVTVVATLSQNRFGYYLAANLALLSAWMCDAALAWASSPDTVQARPAKSGKAWAPEQSAAYPGPLRPAVVGLAIFTLVFMPGTLETVRVAGQESGVPPPSHAAMRWLRDNSPEPFGSPRRYLARGHDDEASDSPSYTVMNWWDFGYRVTAIARRVPVANPTQAGAERAARFFTATTEHEANALMREARSRYVEADDSLPFTLHEPDGVVSGLFASIATWAHAPLTRFFEVYYEPNRAGRLSAVLLYYPDYYQTMAHRLFVRAGTGAIPRDSTSVISYAERSFGDGRRYRQILQARRFTTFEEAQSYLTGLGPGLHRIVGRDPMQTPIPLEALAAYRLVHEEFAQPRSPAALPAVRIFEFSASQSF